MLRSTQIPLALYLGLLATGVAQAALKLMPLGKPATVAKSTLSVTPSEDWNRLGARFGRNAESWTLDGVSLNDLTFYGGIANDATLFREVNKKERPLPRFSNTMLAPDIAQLFEGSYRIANNTSLMSIDLIEPATFAGQQGFKFVYSFTVQNEEVKRRGEARGAIIDGKLYMITFEAPIIHYYDRDIETARRVFESAVVGPAPKKK
jgi:hypothetical protein